MLWIDVYDSVPVPDNIPQRRTAIEGNLDNIPQATNTSLISFLI
jgi:hypothetical protein